MSAGTLTWDPGLGCHRPWRDTRVDTEMIFREEATDPGGGRPWAGGRRHCSGDVGRAGRQVMKLTGVGLAGRGTSAGHGLRVPELSASVPGLMTAGGCRPPGGVHRMRTLGGLFVIRIPW